MGQRELETILGGTEARAIISTTYSDKMPCKYCRNVRMISKAGLLQRYGCSTMQRSHKHDDPYRGSE